MPSASRRALIVYRKDLGMGKRAGPTSDEIVEAVLEASIPAPSGPPLSCSQCEFKLDPRHFSSNQLKKKEKRRCSECLRPGSGPVRPQKRPAVLPGNSAVLTQLPAALFETICDMFYDYDPVARASSNYRAEADTSSKADPQLINERAAGLWVAGLLSCASREAARMVGDWADGMVSKRKIFIEQDARMAMARAVLRQSSTAGGRLFVQQKRGLGTLRAYDDLIRESADAIQLQKGNEAALERFVLMVLDTDHPHSCIGSYKFEASRVTAENIGAAVFLHVDREDRLQPRRQKTKTHHLRLFCPLASTRNNQIEWQLDLQPNTPCSLENDIVRAIDCSGHHDWYEEQRANFQDELSLGEFSTDCGFHDPTSSGLLVDLCLEPVTRLSTPAEASRAVWEVVAHADATVYGAFVRKPGANRFIGETVDDAECFFMVDKMLLQGLLESPSARLRDEIGCADNAKKRLRRLRYLRGSLGWIESDGSESESDGSESVKFPG